MENAQWNAFLIIQTKVEGKSILSTQSQVITFWMIIYVERDVSLIITKMKMKNLAFGIFFYFFFKAKYFSRFLNWPLLSYGGLS